MEIRNSRRRENTGLRGRRGIWATGVQAWDARLPRCQPSYPRDSGGLKNLPAGTSSARPAGKDLSPLAWASARGRLRSETDPRFAFMIRGGVHSKLSNMRLPKPMFHYQRKQLAPQNCNVSYLSLGDRGRSSSVSILWKVTPTAFRKTK